MTRPWGGGAWKLRDSAGKATCLFCPLPLQTQAAATCRNIMDREIAQRERKKKCWIFIHWRPFFNLFFMKPFHSAKIPKDFYRFASSTKTKGFGNLKADGCSANVVRWQLLGALCWYRPPSAFPFSIPPVVVWNRKAWNKPFFTERLA